jgi:arabinose-5-phosphate isomerase
MQSRDQLEYARDIIRTEGQALLSLSERLHESFTDAADLLYECEGNIIVTGMGKAGLVGQKVAATLASTGTNSHFLHAGEAVHGDLGRVHKNDLVLALSYSGETEEIIRLLPTLKDLGVQIIAITGNPQSRLGASAAITLDIGPIREADHLELTPSTSTTAMLALGDALALLLSRRRGFHEDDFARFHPGGALGKQLTKVEEIMRPLYLCRVAEKSLIVRDALADLGHPGRRSGAVIVVDANGYLCGIFTDSDLARILEQRKDEKLDGVFAHVMTRNPKVVRQGSTVSQARKMMDHYRISELPVIDAEERPIGLVDITDIVGWMK